MVLTGADTKISFLWHNLSSECGLIMTPAAGPHLDCHHSSLSLCQSFNHRAQPTEPGREHLAPAPTQETREQVGGDWWPVQHRRDKTSLSKWGHIFMCILCVCVYSISYYYINKGILHKKKQTFVMNVIDQHWGTFAKTSPSRAWLRLNAFLVLACLHAWIYIYFKTF